MAQQTAVEWLLERVCNDILDDEYINKLSIEKTQLFNKISIQAKQMEKEQIINTYLNACSRLTPYGYYNDSAEQYYNETYNK